MPENQRKLLPRHRPCKPPSVGLPDAHGFGREQFAVFCSPRIPEADVCVKKRKPKASADIAGIEYLGQPGISLDCQAAVVRMISSGRVITNARVITAGTTHALLLTDTTGDHIGIKSGFASGYGGTGPHCFSFTLQLLDAHGCELVEVGVRQSVIERLDNSALSTTDLKRILAARPIMPNRIFNDYILNHDHDLARQCKLWDEVAATMPFALIDNRIFDLALTFRDRPDATLLAGYKRLEDKVRERTKLKGHGQRLFSDAFLASDAPLHWKGIDDAERIGRSQLFTGTYAAHRNPRAHRHRSQSFKSQLSEFLLLNHLFRLEREALGPRKKRKAK